MGGIINKYNEDLSSFIHLEKRKGVVLLLHVFRIHSALKLSNWP